MVRNFSSILIYIFKFSLDISVSTSLKEDLIAVFNENNATSVIITSKPLAYLDIIDTTRNFNVVVEGREICKSDNFNLYIHGHVCMLLYVQP